MVVSSFVDFGTFSESGGRADVLYGIGVVGRGGHAPERYPRRPRASWKCVFPPEVGLGRVVIAFPDRDWSRANHNLGSACLGKIGSVFAYDSFLLKRV